MKFICILGGVLFSAVLVSATIFGTIQGLIHDPQHRPVSGAQVTLKATTSDWTQKIASDNSGEFHFEAVPLGEYLVTVEVPGFAPEQQKLTLTSGRDAKLHFALALTKTKETVEVQDTPPTVNPESSTTTNVVSRQQIASTPGADQTNSLAMITNYTPGAYMVHDQLHIRGGHQVSWLLDGVPVPNTNIASNVGPQFDPKDLERTGITNLELYAALAKIPGRKLVILDSCHSGLSTAGGNPIRGLTPNGLVASTVIDVIGTS